MLGLFLEYEQVVSHEFFEEFPIVLCMFQYKLSCRLLDGTGNRGRDEEQKEQSSPPLPENRYADEPRDGEHPDPRPERVCRLIAFRWVVDEPKRCRVVDASADCPCLSALNEFLVRHVPLLTPVIRGGQRSWTSQREARLDCLVRHC